ncbi:MAG: SdiA-regulated domain-containing protein [Bacteroidota bacterium]
MSIFSMLILALGLSGCNYEVKNLPKDPIYHNYGKGDIGYDLANPDHRYSLDDDLEEISGLSYFRPDQLAMIEDESGTLYIYDFDEDEITKEYKFHKDGDYEGIEMIHRKAYVIKSNGKLYHFKVMKNGKTDTERVETPLNIKNDVEGLCHDPANHRLLIACKGDGDIKGNDVKGKAIYALDLDTYTLSKEPVYTISKKQLKAVNEASDNPFKIKDFSPSGLAVHPKTGQLYVIASDGHLLVVLNTDGSVGAIAPLYPKLFRQPEGICFSPDGDLYIASEGRGGKGYILEFKYKMK